MELCNICPFVSGLLLSITSSKFIRGGNSCWSMCQNSIPFWGWITFFIPSSVDGYLCCLNFLAIVKNAAVNMGEQTPHPKHLEILFSLLWIYTLESVRWVLSHFLLFRILLILAQVWWNTDPKVVAESMAPWSQDCLDLKPGFSSSSFWGLRQVTSSFWPQFSHL